LEPEPTDKKYVMSTYRPLAAVVLAAGEGSRIRSGTPKVLHQLCGRPMVLHVVDALAELPLERVVIVVGHGAERVTKTLQEQLVTEVAVEFVEQRVQRGTGDAVSVALTSSAFDDLDAEDDILVLPGDHPLLSAETIAMLATEHRVQDAAATVLTVTAADPTGYGRVIRDKDDRVDRIVEHADADADEGAVDEINTSIYCFRRNLLAPALRRLSPQNAQGEYYLTDVVEVLRRAGHQVHAMEADPAEVLGYLGPYRLLAADAVLVVGDVRNPALEAGIRELRPGIPVLACTLVPRPTAPIAGRRVAVFTTAGAAAHPALHARLAGREGADVALVSGALADRSALRAALAQTDADVFVTELKAAAVDVVAEAAAARGAELVFLANEPVALDGSAAVDELLAGLVRAATEIDS